MNLSIREYRWTPDFEETRQGGTLPLFPQGRQLALAPFVFLPFFGGGWATGRALRKKRDTDAYGEGWLNKQNGSGNDTEGKR